MWQKYGMLACIVLVLYNIALTALMWATTNQQLASIQGRIESTQGYFPFGVGPGPAIIPPQGDNGNNQNDASSDAQNAGQPLPSVQGGGGPGFIPPDVAPVTPPAVKPKK
jgi:hypothetical protein